MKKIKMFSVAAAFGGILLATGCATTQIDHPGTDPDSGIRSEGTIGSEELRQVAEVAAKDALVFPKFKRFVAEYAAAHNNERPTLKLARTINDTNDPDLNTRELTDMIERVLLMADVVEVTRAEGSARVAAIGDSFLNGLDPRFDPRTVAKDGSLIAADLVMCPKVMSNMVSDGSRRKTVRTFTLEIADIKKGRLMWIYTKQLGFTKSRGVVGW
jgi:PBP1b-binding outer membrane lipoprotein LpoB